ncbi:MAG TPA: hypothetical protein DCF33_05500 [Saprospirales bacterium]|nr:hypothetical protein [Saprospirales bacterium]
MKKCILLLMGIIAGWTIDAQEFAFAAGGDKFVLERVENYKLTVAQKVFDDMHRGRGDFRLQKPTLIMNRKPGDMASFIPDKLQVILDEKAYDVCVSFGKDSLNALAALLGHELIHYYENHDWNRHFAKKNENLETTAQLEKLQEGCKHEAQADYLGGFMAFSVGYNTYGIMPKLLVKLYQTYDYPENLPGYPSLEERLKMVNSAMIQLKDLQIVFETANLLTILEQYSDASVYYKNILQTFQGREIYNNAGVNAALAALALTNPADMPFVYPLELDPKSRLFGLKSSDKEKEVQRANLLKLALDYFERARILDENYAPSYLNKACVLALQEEWEDADYLIKKGKKKATDPATAGDFQVLEGIMAAMQKDSVKALDLFRKAETQGSIWATINIGVLKRSGEMSGGASIPGKGVEEIEQFPLADFLAAPNPDREVKVDKEVFCGVRQFKQSKLFIHYANAGKKYLLVQETQAGYSGRTLRNIGLGDSQDKVKTAYGNASRKLALSSGSVWVYPEFNLFFRISAQSKVESWGVFRKSST